MTHTTFLFIVEPPNYEIYACYLAASLREQFGPEIGLVGYCPSAKLGSVARNVRRILDRLQCDLRGFATEGRFDPPYPHGNKLLAMLERRDTEFSVFADSDVLCIRPNRVENIVREGHVSVSLAASLNWAPQSFWDRVYETCGMEIPEERHMLMRQKRGLPRIPYFSSGFVGFPERHRSPAGLSFPETWMELGRRIDADPEVPHKRPYLDQITLPLAIRKSGLDWNILPEEQHYILGGRMRGEPLPEDKEIYTVHYRTTPVLKEVGLARAAKDYLERQAGVRRVSQARRAAMDS